MLMDIAALKRKSDDVWRAKCIPYLESVCHVHDRFPKNRTGQADSGPFDTDDKSLETTVAFAGKAGGKNDAEQFAVFCPYAPSSEAGL